MTRVKPFSRYQHRVWGFTCNITPDGCVSGIDSSTVFAHKKIDWDSYGSYVWYSMVMHMDPIRMEDFEYFIEVVKS